MAKIKGWSVVQEYNGFSWKNTNSHSDIDILTPSIDGVKQITVTKNGKIIRKFSSIMMARRFVSQYMRANPNG